MLSLLLSPDAETDLDDIWTFIAADSNEAADRVIDAITGKFEMLQTMPNSGRQRNELRTGLCNLPIGKFSIFYQVTEDTIEIVRILHGARDLPSLLGEGH